MLRVSFKKYFIIGWFGLALYFSSYPARADIETLFSNEKKSDIQTNDIPVVESAIEKATGMKGATVEIEWGSFKNVSYSAAQGVGGNLQTLARSVVNGDAELKKNLGLKVKKYILKNDVAQTVPAFKLDKNSLYFIVNYEKPDWNKAGPLKELMKKAVK